MTVIDEIKQRILQLDAGSFQSMCDRYLSKIGYPNIVSLGTQAGTQKTTRGTPDKSFCQQTIRKVARRICQLHNGNDMWSVGIDNSSTTFVNGTAIILQHVINQGLVLAL